MKGFDCSVVVKVKATGMVQSCSECSSGDISTAESSVTKLGMVMHHDGPERHARRLVCYFQGQGYSGSSYNQI